VARWAILGVLTLGDATTSGTLGTEANLLAQAISRAGGGRVDVADGTTATLSGIIGDAGA
jgi:hypothetical protein